MDARSQPNIGRNDNPPPGEKTGAGREPQPTHDAYPVFRSQDCPTESARLGSVAELANGHIMGHFTYTPTSMWGCEWHAVPAGEPPPPLFHENEDDNSKPQPTHDAYAINRSPGYPLEWIRLGSVTRLKNGIRSRFTKVPASGWGWKWLAVPIGEEPPPLSAEPPPAKAAPQSRPEPEKRMEKYQPLPGEEDEPQESFSRSDNDR